VVSEQKQYERYLEFIKRLQPPPHFKFLRYDKITDADGETVLSAGAVFLDTRTSGLEIIHYRIAHLVDTKEKGVLVKKYKIDWGKDARICLLMNHTPEQINEYINKITYDDE
jgi:hypothetical protein